MFFKSAGLLSSRRPKEVKFFTCKVVTLVDFLLKSFIFSFISRDVWTQGNDSNMPSLLKIMFKIMFLYRILTHFGDEVSQLVVDCVQFSSRLYLTVLFSIRFKPLRAIRDTEENSFFTCACFAVSLSQGKKRSWLTKFGKHEAVEVNLRRGLSIFLQGSGAGDRSILFVSP